MIKVRICFTCGTVKEQIKKKPITWKFLFVCFDCGCQMNIGFKVWRSGKKKFALKENNFVSPFFQQDKNLIHRSLVNDKESELVKKKNNQTNGV